MKRMAALAIAMLTLAGGGAFGAVKVELLGESSVAGGVVRLKDVALVEGDGSAELSALIVCPAPAAGESLTLPAERIKQRVAAVLGGAEVTMAGPGICRVTRSATPLGAEATGSQAHAGRQPKAGTLEAAIRRFVLERMAGATGTVRLEFDAKDREVLDLTDERWRFKLVSGTNQMEAGSAVVRAEIYENSKPNLVARSSRIQFNIVLVENVVAVARDVRAGDVLAAEDVRAEQREFREPPRGLLVRDLADAVGATARSNLPAGRLLRPEDLTKTLMVRRGDAVTVYVRGSGFTIKAVCRALESGERGSAVAVQGQDGSGKFYATVIGPRTVELALAAEGAKDSVGKSAPALPRANAPRPEERRTP